MNRNSEREAVFREVQQFRQRWLWVLLILTVLTIISSFGYGMLKQLVFGKVWGNRPMSDFALAIVGTIVIFFVVGLAYFFYVLKLITEVRDNALYIRFFPLSQKVIPLDNIKKCEVRKYSPIKEYGGWGIKYGRKGKAYNVSGNLGVQLEFTKGKPLLIGSQKPEKLAQVIKMQMLH